MDYKKILYLLGFYNKIDDDDQPDDLGYVGDWDDPEPAPAPSNVRRLQPASPQGQVVDIASVRGNQGGEPSNVRPVEMRQQPAHVPPTGTVHVINPAPSPAMLVEEAPRVTDKVAVIETAVFEDCEEIGEYLRKRQPVVVDNRYAEFSEARRIVDYISGAAHVLELKPQMGARHVFILTPKNVTISPEAMKQLRDRGLLG